MTEQEFYTWLGAKFKILREEKGVNQNKLAKKLGIPRSLLVEFEENGKRISAFRLNQLMSYFGLTTIKDAIAEYIEPPELTQAEKVQKKNTFHDLTLKQRLQFLLRAAEDVVQDLNNDHKIESGSPATRQAQSHEEGEPQEA